MSTRGKFILLVEDNPDDVELTLRAFTKNRIANDVVVVTDGQLALDWLFCEGAHAGRDPSDQPTIVLLDVNLPKVNGLQVLKHMRQDARTHLLPVVMLTSSKEDRDVVASYDLGANSYIRKPVGFTEFVEAARQLGFYWLLLNEAPPPQKGEP